MSKTTMTPKELEFLKHIVITEYQASETGCFFAADRDKLVALLDAEIARLEGVEE